MRGRERRVWALAAAAAAMGGVFAARSSASDKFWSNPLGGSFHLDANWTGGAPVAGDNAIFGLGSILPYVVSLSSDVTNNQLIVGNDQLQLAFTPGVTYTLTSASPLAPSVVVGDLAGDVGQLSLLNATIMAAGQVVVGADGDGRLTIPGTSRLSGGDASIGFAGDGHLFVQSGGRFTSSNGSIGTNAGADGAVIVEDLTSSWINSGNLFVGDFGTGSLLVANAAFVQSGGVYSGYAGTGGIAVDGNGALRSNSFIRVGDTATGVGTLNMTAGGTAESVSGSVGFSGGSGSVLVHGIDSRWTVSGTLDVGLSGAGTMTIQDRGMVFAGVMNIGTESGGNGTVTVGGTNSMLSVTGLLTVGKAGKGTLLVDSGAIVNSGGGVIGASSAGPNVASIGGSGSSWNMGANQLVIGDDGSGTLEVSGGATVTNGPAILGRSAGSDGTVVLDEAGTSWTSGGLVNIGLSGSGLLQVSGGALVSGTSAIIGGNAGGAGGSGAAVLSEANSTWNLTSALIVGGGGVGNVALSSGAKLFNASATIGDGIGSTGIVELESPGTSWTSSGLVRIGNNGSGDVTLEGGASATSGSLDIGINGAGNLSVTGANSSWTSNGPMRVGVAHFGTLLIDAGGAMASPSATIGSADGAIGQVNVKNGSSWNNSGVLNVGRGGADGVVTVEGGGQLTSGASNIGGDGNPISGNGAVIVKGISSHWVAGAIVLGLGGSGDVEALNGGVIDAASLVISNGPASSLGFAKVADGGSRLNVSGPIEVGRDVNGTLDVSNGGVVTSAGGMVASLASATGIVSIAGSNSRWNIGGNLDLGVNGAGTLNLSSGGMLSAANGFVGRGPSGTGTASISGAGSQLALSDSLYIGGDSLALQGNGMISVASGATVSATNQIKVWATGTLDLNLANVSTGVVDLQGGLLSGIGTVASPASSTNGRISTGGTLAMIAPLSIVTGTNLTKTGTGTLRIDGTQNHGAGSTLHVAGGAVIMNSDAGTPATAATAATANLIVRVSGSSVTLGSDQELMGLNVDFANPGPQSFNLNTATAPGTFRSVRVYPSDLAGTKLAIYAAMRNANASGAPDPSDGIFDSGLASHANAKLGIAQLTDLHGDPYILIRPTRIGDLNLDGQVTISDFIDLASNFNSVNRTWQEGDLNYDGSVTISDFIDLASNFNGSYSGSIQTEDAEILASFASSIGVDPAIIGSAVPEPAGLMIALLATPLLARRRRRR